MKIAIVSEYPRSADRALGGVQVVVRRFAAAMASMSELEVHVVAFDEGLAGRADEVIDGVHVHRFPATRRFGNLTLGRRERRVTVQALREIAPDIAHAHVLGPQSLGTADAGLPWVATAHGILDAYGKILRGLANRARAWSYTTMERLCLRRVRHLIVINPYIREYFGDRIHDIATYEIENPVDDVFFVPEGPRDASRIVFAGRIVPLKDPVTLLHAVRELAREGLGFELRMIGPADDPEYVRSLNGLARRLGVAERLRFQGSLSLPELARELSQAGVFVLPSQQETASVAVMEAMAAGLPVVATDVGGTRHLVDDGRSGILVPVRSASPLAAALGSYLRDPRRASEHGRAGRRIAEDRFRLERAVARTLEVYEHVIRHS